MHNKRRLQEEIVERVLVYEFQKSIQYLTDEVLIYSLGEYRVWVERKALAESEKAGSWRLEMNLSVEECEYFAAVLLLIFLLIKEFSIWNLQCVWNNPPVDHKVCIFLCGDVILRLLSWCENYLG